MVLTDNTNVCCPEWFDLDQLQKEFPEEMERSKNENGRAYPSGVSLIENPEDLLSNWYNPFHKKLRESMLNGDYRFCTTMCPFVNQVYSGTDPKDIINFEHKDSDLDNRHSINVTDPFPKRIYFNFDKACNLKCPSCRVDVIANDSTPHAQTKLETIDRQFGSTVEKIIITGSGDPFYSNIFRTWLQEFDDKKYPNLKSVYLVTNGNMFTPKMWKSIKGVRPYLQQMEWSIDAGTKHTYEARTRLNGKWKKLLANMKFLASLNHFENVVFSFVVQRDNYREMHTFVELIQRVFKDSTTKPFVLFRRLQDWGHQSASWIHGLDICNPNHIEHSAFLEEFEKVVDLEMVDSNLSHLLLDKK